MLYDMMRCDDYLRCSLQSFSITGTLSRPLLTPPPPNNTHHTPIPLTCPYTFSSPICVRSPGIQATFRRRDEFWNMDSTPYYLDEVVRLSALDFEPTEVQCTTVDSIFNSLFHSYILSFSDHLSYLGPSSLGPCFLGPCFLYFQFLYSLILLLIYSPLSSFLSSFLFLLIFSLLTSIHSLIF